MKKSNSKVAATASINIVVIHDNAVPTSTVCNTLKDAADWLAKQIKNGRSGLSSFYPPVVSAFVAIADEETSELFRVFIGEHILVIDGTFAVATREL